MLLTEELSAESTPLVETICALLLQFVLVMSEWLDVTAKQSNSNLKFSLFQLCLKKGKECLIMFSLVCFMLWRKMKIGFCLWQECPKNAHINCSQTTNWWLWMTKSKQMHTLPNFFDVIIGDSFLSLVVCSVISLLLASLFRMNFAMMSSLTHRHLVLKTQILAILFFSSPLALAVQMICHSLVCLQHISIEPLHVNHHD